MIQIDVYLNLGIYHAFNSLGSIQGQPFGSWRERGRGSMLGSGDVVVDVGIGTRGGHVGVIGEQLIVVGNVLVIVGGFIVDRNVGKVGRGE